MTAQGATGLHTDQVASTVVLRPTAPVLTVDVKLLQVLAVAVPPMAIAKIYFGLREQRERHRRLARWTFPIWLYVSVTGVVVYWMLYQMYGPAS